MPISSYIHSCACRMLDVKDLPLDLRNYLDDIEMYANLVDGTIASRQVVAIALASYRRLRTLENDVNTLDWNKLRMRGDRA